MPQPPSLKLWRAREEKEESREKIMEYRLRRCRSASSNRMGKEFAHPTLRQVLIVEMDPSFRWDDKVVG
ncbi:MAG: hypothetical protein KAJ07_01975, partial [Planctomycetes bacterium]|nr:hypothetical protein [Planctomycetota bacterium]